MKKQTQPQKLENVIFISYWERNVGMYAHTCTMDLQNLEHAENRFAA